MTLRHIPLEDTKRTFHQHFLFWSFFHFGGEVWCTFPGYVGKIIDNLVLSIQNCMIFGLFFLNAKKRLVQFPPTTPPQFSWICMCFFYGLGSHGIHHHQNAPPFKGVNILKDHFFQAPNKQSQAQWIWID